MPGGLRPCTTCGKQGTAHPSLACGCSVLRASAECRGRMLDASCTKDGNGAVCCTLTRPQGSAWPRQEESITQIWSEAQMAMKAGGL